MRFQIFQWPPAGEEKKSVYQLIYTYRKLVLKTDFRRLNAPPLHPCFLRGAENLLLHGPLSILGVLLRGIRLGRPPPRGQQESLFERVGCQFRTVRNRVYESLFPEKCFVFPSRSKKNEEVQFFLEQKERTFSGHHIGHMTILSNFSYFVDLGRAGAGGDEDERRPRAVPGPPSSCPFGALSRNSRYKRFQEVPPSGSSRGPLGAPAIHSDMSSVMISLCLQKTKSNDVFLDWTPIAGEEPSFG